MKKILYIIIALISSCSTTQNVKHVDIYAESLLDDKSLICDSYSLFYGNNDSSVLFSHLQGSYSVKKAYLNSDNIDNLIRVGRGNSEYIGLLANGIEENGNFYSLYFGSICEFSSNGKEIKRIALKNRLSRIKKINDYYIGNLNATNIDKMFTICNDRGEYVGYFGDFPEDGKNNGFSKMMAYQGVILTNNNLSKVAFLSSHGKIFDIYHINSPQEVDIVCSKREVIPDYEIDKGQGYGVTHNDLTPYYVDAYGTDKYIYVLYSGKKVKNRDVDSYISAKQSNDIYIYNWNGELLRVLNADTELISICVSGDDKHIIATYHDHDGYTKLCRFNTYM